MSAFFLYVKIEKAEHPTNQTLRLQKGRISIHNLSFVLCVIHWRGESNDLPAHDFAHVPLNCLSEHL